MNDNFNIIMDTAIKRCEGKFTDTESQKIQFNLIYPFTTENIAGYINEFDLKNKSLLTVGSSGDQAINAIFNGCKDISVLDINPYTKFYYYLKVASILSLNLNEFMRFLRFKSYPNTFQDNKDIFNKESYNKLKSTLRSLDYESYLFWNELFNKFNPIIIRNNLFSTDENIDRIVSNCNLYLQDSIKYENTKNKIKNINPNFINGDLFKINLQKKYDSIWLSNIGTYLKEDLIKTMTDKVTKSLNTNGNILISYLYKTNIDTKYKDHWALIYDLEKTFKILAKYNPFLISFIGIDGLKFKEPNMKDSILVYSKH